MALQMISPQSVDRLAMLVIGPAGIGKTSLLRTLCGEVYDQETGHWVQNDQLQPEKVCVLSAEGGLLCVRDLVVKGAILGYEIGSLDDFMEAQQMCMNQQFKNEGYRWIFIDSLTEISARCVETFERKYPLKDDSFKLWGDYNKLITSIIKGFRDLTDYNVIFTCLETWGKDTDKVRMLTPDIAGNAIKNRLTSYFDEVLHMEVQRDPNGKEVHVFSTQSPIGMAKDRSGKLARYELPNLLAVQQKILN